MKLCKLRFKNINSLAGEWSIDFTDEAYAQGMFTITGDTGAGKSSILDAMCLALYGRTPRQKVATNDDKVITYGAGDCLAEAVFESGGKRYCAQWSHKKNKEGQLDRPEHVISELLDDGTETALKNADGKNKVDVPKKVEEICRLDFGRFTQTVLLPQGKFAEFLRAKGQERAKLLKEITGFEIYSRISELVFHTHKQLEREYGGKNAASGRKRELEELKNSLLSSEERAEKEAFIDGYEEEMERLRARAEELGSAIAWYLKDDKIKAEEKALAERRGRLEKERSDAAQGSAKLARYDRGTTLKDLYGELLKLREETETLKKKGETLSKNLEERQKRADSAQTTHSEAEKKLAAMREKLEELRPLLNRIIEIDAEKAHLTDEENEHTETLKSTCKNLESCKREIDSLTRQSERLAVELSELDKKLEEAKEAHRAAHEMLCRSDLSELAKGLTEGEPCPLCGAVHHPSPYDGAGDARMGELRAEDEARASEVSELEKQVREKTKLLNDGAARLATLQERARKDEETKNTTEQKLQSVSKTIAELTDRKNELSGGKDIVGENEKLKNDISRAENDAKKLSENEKAAASALGVALSSLENNSKLFEEKSEKLAELEKNFSERLDGQGFKDERDLENALSLPPSEAKRLRVIADSIAREQREFEKDAHAVAEKRADMPTAPTLSREGLEEEKRKTEREKEEKAGKFTEAKNAVAADDEKRKESAAKEKALKKLKERLDAYKALNDLIGSSDGSKMDIIVQEMTLRRLVDIANEQLKRFTGRYRLVVSGDAGSSETASNEKDAGSGNTDANEKDTGSGKAASNEKDTGSGKAAANKNGKGNAKAASNKKDTGSGRTAANESMSDSLRLDVIDDDQLGAVRSTSNLSGGETFLVSLSLALAISRSLKRTRIDSLFLDEGFGTLDEESLNTVLSVLSEMRNAGKMIGVISHVADLPRKLGGCSILLSKGCNGHSTICGPGCTRIG